jgi:hypothetical protein
VSVMDPVQEHTLGSVVSLHVRDWFPIDVCMHRT